MYFCFRNKITKNIVMKFTIANTELRRVLACVTRVINPHTPTPILSNILITKDDDAYYIVANSSETELALKIDLDLISGTFEPVCINPVILAQMSAKLGGEQLIFTTSKDKVKIEYLTGSFSLPVFNAEEYPRINAVLQPNYTSFEIAASNILPTLNSGVSMTAKYELRPIMSYEAIDVVNDGFTIAATDGHKMFRRRHIPGAPFIKAGKPRVMLYKAATNGIVKEAFATSENITISGDEDMICIFSEKARFISMNIDTKYPNYDSVIPKVFKSEFTINRKLLIEALERVILVASQSTKVVRFTFTENQTTISSSDSDFSTDGSESVAMIQSTVPVDFHIGFNGASLISELRTAQADEVIIKLNSAGSAMVLVENDPKSEILMLLMPVKED